MVNILIAENDINYVKTIMSFINSNFENARIFNITTNGYETLEVLKKSSNIDIILLESSMPDLDSTEIINQLSSFPKINKYANSFIILSSDNFSLKRLNSLELKVINCSFLKNSNLKLLIDPLNKLIVEKGLDNTPEDIRYRITNELKKLKYSLSHVGTQYLVDTIEYILFNGDNLIVNLSKNVYPIIAKHYNQKCNNIKISIVRATEAMYYNCQESYLIEYFNLDKVSKPKIKTVIQTVVSKVKIL